MIILDTNVLSELIKPQGSIVVRKWVAAQPTLILFTTTITQAEILYGIALLPSGKRQNELNQKAQMMLAEDFAGRILPFDETAAIAFAKIAEDGEANQFPKRMLKLPVFVTLAKPRSLLAMFLTLKGAIFL